MSKKKIFDVVLLVLSALFVAVKTISDRGRIPETTGETE